MTACRTIRGEMDAHDFEPVDESGSDSVEEEPDLSPFPAHRSTVFSKGEDLLHGDDVSPSMPVISWMLVTFLDAVRQPCEVNNYIDGGSNVPSHEDRLGMSKLAMATMVSTRIRASLGELAWMVVSEPSCPVFIA